MCMHSKIIIIVHAISHVIPCPLFKPLKIHTVPLSGPLICDLHCTLIPQSICTHFNLVHIIVISLCGYHRISMHSRYTHMAVQVPLVNVENHVIELVAFQLLLMNFCILVVHALFLHYSFGFTILPWLQNIHLITLELL